MAAAGGSNIGLRKDNEDSFFISENQNVFAIADGMGGHEHGQLASRIAVEEAALFSDRMDPKNLTLETMEEFFLRANAAIHKQQRILEGGIMGTTLTAVAIMENQMYVGHVGDSRLYLLRDHNLSQLTMDHSYYAELLRQGNYQIHPENRQKNVLLKALGPEEHVEGQYFRRSLEDGDLLILCTDGLYNFVNTADMQRILEEPATLSEKVQKLLDTALKGGTSDNLTVVLYRYEA